MNFYLVKQEKKKRVFGFRLNLAESMTIDNCISHPSSKNHLFSLNRNYHSYPQMIKMKRTSVQC